MSDLPHPRRRWLIYAPLGLAVAAGGGFWMMLRGLQDGAYDPRGVPSALLGRPTPEVALPGVEGIDLPAFATGDLRAPMARPILVNFWASWCVPCIIEHPQLMRLSREGVPIFGINYKDAPRDAAAFLERRGNPYAKLVRDEHGRAGIEWGVYGVPETYLIDRQGVIRWRYAGPVTPDTVEKDLAPLLRRYA